MFKRRSKRAQSILEYVIVLTAIVGIIIFAAVNYMKPAVEKTIQHSATAIENAAEKITKINQ